MEIQSFQATQTLTYLNTLNLVHKSEKEYCQEWIKQFLTYLDNFSHTVDTNSLSLSTFYDSSLFKTNRMEIQGKFQENYHIHFSMIIDKNGVVYKETYLEEGKEKWTINPIHLQSNLIVQDKVQSIFDEYDTPKIVQLRKDILEEKILKSNIIDSIIKSENKNQFDEAAEMIDSYIKYLTKKGFSKEKVISIILEIIENTLSSDYKEKVLQNQSIEFEQNHYETGWKIGVNKEILSFHQDDCMFYRRLEPYVFIEGNRKIPEIGFIESSLLAHPTEETFALEKDLIINPNIIKKEHILNIFFFQPDICFTEKDILADYKKEYNQYRLTGGLKTPEDIPFIIEYNSQKDKFTILYDTTNIPKLVAKSVGAKTNGIYIAKFIDENEKEFFIKKAEEMMQKKYNISIKDFLIKENELDIEYGE